MIAVPGHADYSETELKFGPFNLEKRPEAWQTKWQREYDRVKTIMAKLESANKQDSDAYREYQQQVTEISEALGL